MKYAVKIDNVDVLLDQERLDQLIDLLVGTERLVQEYVGNRKGDDGTNYITLVRPYVPHAELTIRCLHDGVYTARKMATEAHDSTK